MTINTHSPIAFTFIRHGGADIHAELQIWHKKEAYSPNDRPIAKLNFGNATQTMELQSINLPNRSFTCVFLGLVRESLNGVYALQLSANDQALYTQQGDVNLTTAPNEFSNLKSVFDLNVT